MEIGVGIHGEPGRRRGKAKRADEIAHDLVNTILEDLKPDNNDEVLLHINGFDGGCNSGIPTAKTFISFFPELFNSCPRIKTGI